MSIRYVAFQYHIGYIAHAVLTCSKKPPVTAFASKANFGESVLLACIGYRTIDAVGRTP